MGCRAPVLPEGLVAHDRVRQIAKGLARARECDAVEPHAEGQPLDGLGLLRAGIERAAALEQVLHRGILELPRHHLRLDGEHERPQLLVPLEKAWSGLGLGVGFGLGLGLGLESGSEIEG